MRVKKYRADSMNDAMAKVRKDLGSDAVILHSKQIQSGGILGLFKKRGVEVIAALDPDQTETEDHVKMERVQDPTPHPVINQQLGELKGMIAALSSSMTDHFPSPVSDILYSLKKQGMKEEYLLELGNRLQRLPEETYIESTEAFLIERLETVPMGGMTFTHKYINLMGPTGVGKTTTLAKLAAEAVIEKRKKVAFLTTDTYRIAAIEQLKTYASLLNVPVEVIYKADDYRAAIEKFRDCDHIFIDTAGRNYREEHYVTELHNLIDFSADMESYLVLSLTSKEEDMREIAIAFSSMKIDRFIFTKLDETSSMGAIFNLILETGIGAAYVTTGQDVPEDIEPLLAEDIARMLMEGIRP
ncbi:flagellar biosynthesis protein FlhF [Rossellomorea marisflavi]|uniref:flagellar biosynthesis protein FlhF n=1 Tax=Rossellomorea marisflavi TaxID=189381 RepID=UPI003459FA89